MNLRDPKNRWFAASLCSLSMAAGTGALLHAAHRPPETPVRPASSDFIALMVSDTPMPQAAPGTLEETPLALVEVDAARLVPADLDAQKTTFGDLLADQGANASPTETPPDWFLWGRWNGSRIAASASLPAPLTDANLSVYAARASEGATVGIANRSDRILKARLRIRLPRGLYRVERLTLTPVSPRRVARAFPQTSPVTKEAALTSKGYENAPYPQLWGNRQVRTAQTPPNLGAGGPFQNAPPPYTARLERLSGRDLANAAFVTKFCALEPGQVCFLRFTDDAATTQKALRVSTEIRDQSLPAT